MDLSCSTGMTRWVRSTLYAGSVCLPMTADERAAVLTARRAAQHFRLSVPHDAYECLCILIISTKPSPVSALCSQIHRRLAVLVPIFLQLWVHCPRASNGLLPRRSNLVGYAQRDARFDRSSLSNNHYQQLSRSQRSMERTVCSFLQTFIIRSYAGHSEVRFMRGAAGTTRILTIRAVISAFLGDRQLVQAIL
jgi:hypothetical protein